MEGGRVGEAIDADEAALKLNQSADSYLQLGHALKLQGLRERAAQAYEAAHAADVTMSDPVTELQGLGYEPDQVTAYSGDPEFPIDIAFVNDAYDLMLSSPKDFRNEPAGDAGRTIYASLEQMLYRRHLTSDFLGVMDPEFYFYTQKLGTTYTSNQRIKCIVHFCTTGVESCAPLGDRHGFDPAFYEENFQPPFRMSRPDAYRHWLNQGIRGGDAPNQAVWLQDSLGIELRDFVSLAEIDLYKAANPSLSHLTKTTDLVRRLVNGGLIADRFLVRPSAETAPVFGRPRHTRHFGETAYFPSRYWSGCCPACPTITRPCRITRTGNLKRAATCRRPVPTSGSSTRERKTAGHISTSGSPTVALACIPNRWRHCAKRSGDTRNTP